MNRADPAGEGTRATSAGRIAVAIGALALGAGIAWMDGRPTWDDSGVTAGALLVTAGCAAAAGLRWWIAAPVVAAPIVLAGLMDGEWSILAAAVLPAAGALLGTGARRALRRD